MATIQKEVSEKPSGGKPQFTVKEAGVEGDEAYCGVGWRRTGQFGDYISVQLNRTVRAEPVTAKDGTAVMNPNTGKQRVGKTLFISPKKGVEGAL